MPRPPLPKDHYRFAQAEQVAPLSANISTPEAEAAAASDQRNLMQNRMSGKIPILFSRPFYLHTDIAPSLFKTLAFPPAVTSIFVPCKTFPTQDAAETSASKPAKKAGRRTGTAATSSAPKRRFGLPLGATAEKRVATWPLSTRMPPMTLSGG